MMLDWRMAHFGGFLGRPIAGGLAVYSSSARELTSQARPWIRWPLSRPLPSSRVIHAREKPDRSAASSIVIQPRKSRSSINPLDLRYVYR